MTVVAHAVSRSRRQYTVVDLFEAELCDYTKARFAITTNSCTNALFLALTWEKNRGVEGPIRVLPRTYIGVLQAVVNAGFKVEWRPDQDMWQETGYCNLHPSRVWDFARCFEPGISADMHDDAILCLSFHAAKQLPLGRGGAILTNNEDAADWFLAARMDGRYPGDNRPPIIPAWHMPCPPDVAARGLDILSRWNDTGYAPPRLLRTAYPDLSQWYP